MDANEILRCMEDSKSVLVTGIRHIDGCCDDKLELHFGRRSNGGGDVRRIDLVDQDTAVITFEDEKVAAFIMGSSKHHVVTDIRVSVESAQRKRQILQGILATREDNGFAEELTNQYRYRLNDDDEDHYGCGGHTSSYLEQLSSFESQRTGMQECSLLPDEAELGEYSTSSFSGDDTDSMEYEIDECSEPTGGTGMKTQRSDSNQPTSIQCTDDVLNYLQTVHFGDLNRIQREHKVTFDIKNRTTVLVKSAASGDVKYIQEAAAKELSNLIKSIKSRTEKEIVTLTPDEADSKNYSAAERDLVKSTSLLVTKVNGRTFAMYGTRSAIDEAKIKLKQMVGDPSGITSSTNAHPPGRHPQNEGRTMDIAEQVEISSSFSSKDQLPRIEKEKPLPKTPSDSSNYNRSSTAMKRNSQEDRPTRGAAFSNQPIRIQCTEDVLNYIQTIHFGDLNRIQRKHNVTFDIKTRTTVLVKSAASGDVKHIQEAAKELSNLIKEVKSGTEEEIVTLTSDEADSKNYYAAERDLVQLTSLLVTKGNGRTFVMYGTRSAINDAKIKLKQMLGDSSGSTSSTNPSLKTPSNSRNSHRSSMTMKRNSQDTKEEAFCNQPISIPCTEVVLNYIQTVHFGDLDRIQRKHKVSFDIKNRTTVLVKSTASGGDMKYIQGAAKELSNLIKDVKSRTEEEIVTLTPDEADSKNYSAAERDIVKSTSLLVTKGNGKTFVMYGTRSAINVTKIKLKQMLSVSSGIASSTNSSLKMPSNSSNSHRSSMTMKQNWQQQDRGAAKGTAFEPSQKQTSDGSTSRTKPERQFLSPSQFGGSNPRQMVDSPATVKPKIRSSERHKVGYPVPHHRRSNFDKILIPRSPKSNFGGCGYGEGNDTGCGIDINSETTMVPSSRHRGRWGYDDRGDTGFCDDISDRVTIFETTIQAVKVIGRKSNIIDEFATVLVCSANNRLQCDHGLAARISKLGGRRVQSQCDNWILNHGLVRDGDIVWVDIDEGMSCSHVINAVVPRWNGHGNGTEELLLKMFLKIFTAARDKLFAHSIALPFIGTVKSGIPRDVYARTFTGALLTFLTQPIVPVQEIRIVDLDENALHLIEKEMQANAHILHEYSRPQPTIAPSRAKGSLYVKPARSEAAASQADFQSFCDGGARPRFRAQSSVADDNKCPVCLGVLRNKKTPVHCSHACCGKCFRELQNLDKHCPVCRGPLR